MRSSHANAQRGALSAVLAHQQLTAWHSGFNVFSYLTFRAILATVSALALSLLVGPI